MRQYNAQFEMQGVFLRCVCYDLLNLL